MHSSEKVVWYNKHMKEYRNRLDCPNCGIAAKSNAGVKRFFKWKIRDGLDMVVNTIKCRKCKHYEEIDSVHKWW